MKPLVNSFDLYDTLIARRGPEGVTELDEMQNVFPIAEMMARVKPEDIIVSDMRFPESSLRKFCGLPNRIFVSDHGKLDGTMWPKVLDEYQIMRHYGDNPVSDYQSPVRFGIPAELVSIADKTDVEAQLYNMGFPQLAMVMREARLTTWHPQKKLRNLQLLQIELNFPFLFLASCLLNQKIWNEPRVLFSSRDCCHWYRIQKLVRDLSGAPYQVKYFLSSRLTRAFPSAAYILYVDSLLPGAIVDMGGTGWSLSRLLERSKYPDTRIIFMHNYHADALHQRYKQMAGVKQDKVPEQVLPALEGSDWIEKVNLARHPMPSDVGEFFNPENIAWEELSEIRVQHDAISACLDVAKHYKLQIETLKPGMFLYYGAYYLSELLIGRLYQMDWADSMLAREDQAVMNELNRRAQLERYK